MTAPLMHTRANLISRLDAVELAQSELRRDLCGAVQISRDWLHKKLDALNAEHSALSRAIAERPVDPLAVDWTPHDE